MLPGAPSRSGGPPIAMIVVIDRMPPGLSTRPISNAACATSMSPPKCSIDPLEKMPSNRSSGKRSRRASMCWTISRSGTHGCCAPNCGITSIHIGAFSDHMPGCAYRSTTMTSRTCRLR